MTKRADYEVLCFNPLIIDLINLGFLSLEAVPRYRDPQLLVTENYLDLSNYVIYISVIEN